MASWCWSAGDVVGRRMAAVGVVAAGTATGVEVAAGFGVDTDTLRRWSRAWEAGGAAALVPELRGPKGPSKLKADVVARVRSLRAGGATIAAIATEVGLSVDSVRAALAGWVAPGPDRPAQGADGAGLEPLALPQPRAPERSLAAAGLLAGAQPRITQGASLTGVGELLILPTLAITGLVDAAQSVLGLPKAAFY